MLDAPFVAFDRFANAIGARHDEIDKATVVLILLNCVIDVEACVWASVSRKMAVPMGLALENCLGSVAIASLRTLDQFGLVLGIDVTAIDFQHYNIQQNQLFRRMAGAPGTKSKFEFPL